MSEPTTEAGRALADSVESLGYDAYDAPHFLKPPRESWEDAILAIEQEARRPALAEVRAAVRAEYEARGVVALPQLAILAAIDKLEASE